MLASEGSALVRNSGTITGLVLLGGGDDPFVQRVGSKLGATVEAGEGSDSFIVDWTGGTSLVAGQIAGFERLLQVGTATRPVSYRGPSSAFVPNTAPATLITGSS